MIFQQYKSKYQNLLINDSHKILRIQEKLGKQFDLADIRNYFDAMKLRDEDVFNEPSILKIGFLEIHLGA
jgi:hypothetical protein